MRPRSEERVQAIDVQVLLAGALLSIILAPSVRAAPVTYTYTGPAFTTFTGAAVCPVQCDLSGSFTVSSALPGGLTNATITPTSFSFTDGLNTLTNLNTTGAGDQANFLLFSTNGAGQITQWEIILQHISLAQFETFSSISGGVPEDKTWIGNPGTTSGTALVDGIAGGPSGSWVPSTPTTTTPEPTTLGLLSTGLLGLGITLTRRKKIAQSL
jgi:hypothetical protein